MINRIKTVLNSEKAMNVVNLLFMLSMLIRNHGIILVVYIVWIVYLVCCIKKTTSKAVKIFNGIFLTFAVSMIAVNLYLLLTLKAR